MLNIWKRKAQRKARLKWVGQKCDFPKMWSNGKPGGQRKIARSCLLWMDDVEDDGSTSLVCEDGGRETIKEVNGNE